MSQLFVVRHGQASFFGENYDQLSPMGEQQSRALAKHWLEQGMEIHAAYSGTLERQIRTAEVVGETYREAGLAWPELVQLEGLNEYQADEIMDLLLPELCEREDRFKRLKADFDAAETDRDRYRTFHRLLEAVMAIYVADEYESNGFERWENFRDRVRGAFRKTTEVEGSGKNVAVFTSGGPVGVSVQTVLEAPDIKAAELNWRVHNCSVTQFTFSKNRITLDTFNSVAHLCDPAMLTYR